MASLPAQAGGGLQARARSVEIVEVGVEATSFVHPKRVPQMADADDAMAGVPRVDGVSYIGLVVNERGLDRALASGVDEVNVVVVAIETLTGVELGASALDSGAGGIGGCPLAPAATGNIATEDLAYQLRRSGIHFGLDLDGVLAAAALIGAELGIRLPALLGRAGDFPERQF